jgi:hypothetical protein
MLKSSSLCLYSSNLGTFWPKIEQFLAISPLLKIEISSNGQNCSILSQKVPKFELYKHNDELFNIYYGIFMNFELLPILTLISSPLFSNLHNRSK